jgi:hypothetical protein
LPTLSDKLKALGVQIGARNLAPPPPRQEFLIETVIPGRLIETSAGSVYVVEQTFTSSYQHGRQTLSLRAPLEGLSRVTNEPLVNNENLQDFAYLDTETSGLAGGTGTYAFLVGAGKYEGDSFILAQFFMRDPTEEPALLLALEAFLARCRVLVTFNGKAFDVPLLNTRYTMQGWYSPLSDMVQVDLLHLARRLWRERLPSRTLGNLEVQILDTHRTADEVPGWMIPQIYFDYLRSADARPLKNVFYHNSMDVLSMATLLNHTADLLANPTQVHPGEETDQAALGRIYEELGEFDLAVQLYRLCLDTTPPEDHYWATLERLSMLHKRRGELHAAMPLWEQAAARGYVYAHIELAKVYEHSHRNFTQAAYWTEQALNVLARPDFPLTERLLWQPELEHRLQRLNLKLGR